MTLIGAGDGTLNIDLTDHRPQKEGETTVVVSIERELESDVQVFLEKVGKDRKEAGLLSLADLDD
ncbi:MAG: hypothetical protein UR39_C0007G0013 [Candidatus Woesebacteria bacterium GW2011_GWA1_33_30]|uniref:Uncharacterized protein n=1 Tax=Candidatus Woesebacteria bacterium GW2011_GWA2_33_28 TaxID=1618561 RepID=A0A0G0C6L6_9BACT|nr:MAG: hypothetical protein UR38_C0007G0013 [Candidatus Woesebacteria bacterium GW2011_GWA2_33_28]KKP47795.1 MAG: hypothetical protein UR39_C0007G0013 [Candidatus Woesebacteria bacterium GW2011_GWA1_33_30]KKP49240.1 MAG: hypothetical protein UR40_C0008G0013 [Microgenomates group bacterium GW2011_GWC1_33_32]KKP51607.1 MAG: hypothetical protein UR44_C0008G0009 [Candidatus Woesebacteria bacterium GW2011_GWB1_33_38]KKP56187.1 MAG: hypothetical protein UR48_C0038G0004 [Microgenomates group bacteriu